MKGFSYLPDVATLELDREACVGCGMCEEVCPHQVFVLRGDKAEIVDARPLHGVRRLPDELPGRGDPRSTSASAAPPG